MILTVIDRILDSAECLGRFPHIGRSGGAAPGTTGHRIAGGRYGSILVTFILLVSEVVAANKIPIKGQSILARGKSPGTGKNNSSGCLGK
jgi:hypothetical protein